MKPAMTNSASMMPCAARNGGSDWVGRKLLQRTEFLERLHHHDEHVEVEPATALMVT